MTGLKHSVNQSADHNLARFLGMDTGFAAFDFFSQTIRADEQLGTEMLKLMLDCDENRSHQNVKYLLRNLDHLAELLEGQHQDFANVVKEHLLTISVFLKNTSKNMTQLLRMLPLTGGDHHSLVGAVAYSVELNRETDTYGFEQLLEEATDEHLKEMVDLSMTRTISGYTFPFLDFACKAYLTRLPLRDFKSSFILSGNSTEASGAHRLEAMTTAIAEACATGSVPLKKILRFTDLAWEAVEAHDQSKSDQFARFERHGVRPEIYAHKPHMAAERLARDLGL